MLEQIESLSVQEVGLDQALGMTLVEDILTDRDQPPFNRSAMDGFAVRSEDIKANIQLNITGTVAAGAKPICYQTPVQKGCAYHIATGAPVPVGADAVIPIEYAAVDPGNPSRVRFYIDSVPPAKNIHPQGADAKAGQIVVAKGTILKPQHIGIAAASGQTQLKIRRKPKIILLTTGDEVCPANMPLEKLQPQQIRNSNGPMLVALLSAMGIDDVQHQHIPDDAKATFEAAQKASKQADLVITVGGISVGQRDHLPSTWEKLGVEVLVHGCAIKPGKPVYVAKKKKTLILGLPGNPVSVLTTAHLFLLPAIRKMLDQPLPHWQEITWVDAIKRTDPRDRFMLVRVIDKKAHLLTTQGSGDLMHTALADGFICVKSSTPTCKTGQTVPFMPLLQ